jgi:hypothetical protein
MEPTIAVSLGLSLLSAAAFLAVAVVLARRNVSAPMRGANNAFVIWWAAIAASTLLTGFETALAAAGDLSVPLFRALSILSIPLLCLALWGLLHYLIVLLSGTRRWGVPLGVLYALLAGYFFWLTGKADYTSVHLGRWTATLEPQPMFGGWAIALLVFLIIGPQMLAALVYFGLVFRVDDPATRKRILLVSLSILVWFGAAIVISLLQEPGKPASDAAELTTRLLGLAAACAVLYAYIGVTPRTGAPHEPSSTQERTGTEPQLHGPKLMPASQPLRA